VQRIEDLEDPILSSMRSIDSVESGMEYCQARCERDSPGKVFYLRLAVTNTHFRRQFRAGEKSRLRSRWFVTG
jgi:hypothetical protein